MKRNAFAIVLALLLAPCALLATMLVASSIVQAQPILLSCEGEMRVVARNVSEKTTLSLKIDAGKVQVGSSWGSSAISSKPDQDTMIFGKSLEPTFGEPTGAVNRLTGETSIYILTLTDGVYRYYGYCKPAQKLF